ncbi:hypothetical protein ACN47E_001498 [Coniothyrium glycines]
MGSPSGPSTSNTEDACVICLSPVSERAITVPCNHHNFDFVCLVSWIQERATCPLCKAEVTAVQYDFRSPYDFSSYAVPPTHPRNDVDPRSSTQRPSLFAPFGLPNRPRAPRRPYSPPVDDVALRRRRDVYRNRRYSLHVGSNRFSGYRDISPQMMADSLEMQSRARTWIRRELRVFTFLYVDAGPPDCTGLSASSNAEFLLSYIVSILKMVEIKSSNGHAENLLSEYLGRDNARQFLHELHSWLRSPYTKVEEWDEEVQYLEDIA